MTASSQTTSPFFHVNRQPSNRMNDDVEMLLLQQPSSSSSGAAAASPHANALVYNLTVLKEKVQQLQPLVRLAVEADSAGSCPSSLISANSLAGDVVQEIVAAASAMRHTFQQMAAPDQVRGSSAPTLASGEDEVGDDSGHRPPRSSHRYGANYAQNHHVLENCRFRFDLRASSRNAPADDGKLSNMVQEKRERIGEKFPASSSSPSISPHEVVDIVELDADELLAKHTHYCQVCGKGFKRNANLRMHMRAHGDEYKTSSSLAKGGDGSGGAHEQDPAGVAAGAGPRKKYSCPYEGCRWNRRHESFTPLKSVISVKNHYRRSHCPKLYVCKRCSRKHFSVLSDLRTHEKHCGRVKWVCSCGTTFSRKDKLMGHVSLFVGHNPALAATGSETEET